jgi:hypothetical protein
VDIMATSDGDVIMSDVSNNGDTASAAPTTSVAPATGTTAPSTAPSVASTSQSRRTDHDRQQYFFMPKAPLKRSRPHVSQNLIADYGLNPVHDRVRRVDPATGEKINKLRKSYVGIVKGLRIAGSNKEVVTPNEWLDTEHVHDPQGLMDQRVVEDGFDVVEGMQVPRYETVWKKDIEPVTKQAAQGLLAKLSKAVQMVPGKLDDNEKWRKLLGDDVVKKPVVPLPPSLKAPAVASSSARPSPRMGPTTGRAQRAGAKRSYDDTSYAGYGDTYEDISSSDQTRKKQRKVHSTSSQKHAPPPSPLASEVSTGTKTSQASYQSKPRPASKWKTRITKSKRKK